MNEKSITTITLKKINKKSVYQYIYEHRQTAKQQIENPGTESFTLLSIPGFFLFFISVRF